MQYRALADHYVYILTNSSRTLYVGVTNNLFKRVYEQTGNLASAVAREKQLKGWRRSKKVELIEAFNPAWKDLSMDWYEDA